MFSRIKDLCSQFGITVTALERECGFSKGSVCKWGKITPSFDKIQKVAKRFGVRAEWLATGEGPKTALDALQLFGGYGENDKKKSLDEENLTEGERAILELFRQLPAEKQHLVNTMLELALSKLE